MPPIYASAYQRIAIGPIAIATGSNIGKATVRNGISDIQPAILVVREGIGQSEAFVHCNSSGIHAIPLYLRSTSGIQSGYSCGSCRHRTWIADEAISTTT